MVNKGEQKQMIAAITATLGAMVVGTILGWTSSAQLLLPQSAKFDVTDEDALSYGPVFALGALGGCIEAGLMLNTIGYRYSIAIYEALVAVGWVILTVPTSKIMLSAGRILQGLGVGGLCAVIPLYVGETSQPKIRGKLGSMFQVFVVIGILYSYICGSILKYKIFNIASGVWPLVHILGMFLLPESPYYLLRKNRDEDATLSMKNLRDDEATEEIAQELKDIKSRIEEEKALQGTLSKVFSIPSNRRALYIAIGCMFFQQMSGVNVIIFYLHSLFDDLNISMKQNTAVIIVGVVQLVATLVCLALIDKTGRRKLLIASGVLMAVCMAGVGVYSMVYANKAAASSIVKTLPLILIAVYIVAFSLGFGPVPWVVVGEIFSAELKPYGTSLAGSTNWILVFVVTFLPKILIKSIKRSGMFYVFAAFCVVAIAFVWFYVPEMKNKSLADIQTDLASDVPVTETSATSPPATTEEA